MRFGCCTFFVAEGKDRTGIETIERIAEAGYDYVELPIAEITDLPEDKFNEYLNYINSLGVKCECGNNFVPGFMKFTGPEVTDIKEFQAYCKKAFERSNMLGINYIVFGSFWTKKVPEGFSHERAYEQLVEVHKELDVWARESGITIGIEPLRRPLCNIITTFEEGCKLARDINGTNINVILDNYHMDAEKEDPSIIIPNSKYLGHVHFSNPNLDSPDRLFPIEVDEWNYEPLVRVIKASGYDGRISVEASAKDFNTDVKKSLEVMKLLFT